jgi:hypothetical protein
VGIGDMSEEQYIRRFCSRVAKMPLRSGRYHYPIRWIKQETDKGKPVFIPRRSTRRAKGAMTAEQAKIALTRFSERYLRTTEPGKFLKILVDSSMSLERINTRIQELQDRSFWIPDVLIIDYADRLDAPRYLKEKLEQVDYNWKFMRQLALDYHCLVLTATQVRRSGYGGRRLQTRDDAADNKNKNAHVTGLIGINVNSLQELYNVRTLNWVVQREHTSRSIVHTAGCPALSNPCVISC